MALMGRVIFMCGPRAGSGKSTVGRRQLEQQGITPPVLLSTREARSRSIHRTMPLPGRALNRDIEHVLRARLAKNLVPASYERPGPRLLVLVPSTCGTITERFLRPFRRRSRKRCT